jgi:hypothetical protein
MAQGHGASLMLPVERFLKRKEGLV